MKTEESKLQQSCVKWFRLQYPKELLFAIPNGGQRSKITASILKAEGTVAGIPDLFLAKHKFGKEGTTIVIHHGLFIEMKTATGRLSKDQEYWLTKLNTKGYLAKECRSGSEAIELIEAYMMGSYMRTQTYSR